MVTDLTGQKFARLTAIRRTGRDKHRVSLWECRCECGNTVVVRLNSLTDGNTKSCGCFMRDNNRLLMTRHNTTHGLSYSPTYRIWAKMKERCENQRAKAYVNYGARGIAICERWHSFENLLADMGPRPSGMTIERKDNNGDYRPENCIWATTKEQGNNKRNNHILEFNGKRKTVSQWGEEIGVNYKTIFTRLHNGWSIEDALTTRKLKPWEHKRATGIATYVAADHFERGKSPVWG